MDYRKNYYTTEGSTRKCCGHKHRSFRTAKACLLRDDRGCARQGGYTDRKVVRYVNEIKSEQLPAYIYSEHYQEYENY